MRHTKNKA